MKNQNSDALFGEILVLLQRLRAEDMLTEIDVYRPALHVAQLLKCSPVTAEAAKQIIAELTRAARSDAA